jgi:poly [ADP-ribose] polymerase
MSIVREAKYIKSDIKKNNNKFWYIYEHDDATVETHWGRVGDGGQRKTKDFGSQSAASSFFDRKCKEKERSGRNGEIAYRPLNIIGGTEGIKGMVKTVDKSRVKEIAKKQIKTNNPTVAKLIDYLSQVNAHNITQVTGGQITYNDTTGLFSTPLGIITQDNIDDANNILLEIGDLVADNKYGVKLKNRTNDYLMMVPQNIGRKKLDVEEFWSDLNAVQRQKAIVDSLQASLVTATSDPSRKKTDSISEEKVFDVVLTLMDDKEEKKRIFDKYYRTRKTQHSCSYLKPCSIYSVRIGKMEKAWQKDGAKMSNIMELWHGSSCANLLSIMSRGFIIPPPSSSNVTGRMFSDGVYASNISTKALGYSTGFWGQSSYNRYFMFLVDMAMGKYYVPNGASSNLPKKGYDSTFAKPRISGVLNEEMIVYRTSQVHPKYLVEFK